MENEDILLEVSRAVGEIDSMIALANGARTMRLNRPRMTEENVLRIYKGCHLLQISGSRAFVPNDCLLAGGDGLDVRETRGTSSDKLQTAAGVPSTIVVTGPNHSGKSMYLKQAAIIVFLAHIGSFVPAEEATIGITDRILTRIATHESVSRDESTFGVDLQQAALSMNLATRKSLVLIDEFGKGTSMADGAALSDALLNHFLRLGPGDAPKVLVATHFHEIFERKGFTQHPRLRLFHMGVTVDLAAPRPEDRVGFLHELREGRSAESFGCHCAAISGILPLVVERASQVSMLLCEGADIGTFCLRARGDSIKGLQNNEDMARHFLVAMDEALDSGPTLRAPRELLQQIFSRE